VRILICDYESQYRFPANGYGSIERWLASAGRYLLRLGHEVVLSGPLWNIDMMSGATWWPERLCRENCDRFLRRFGHMDRLLAGHEAFGRPEWDEPYLSVASHCVSYQHGHELYPNRAYDGDRKRLFCFSDEMMGRFRDQAPRKLPCYSEGISERPRRLPAEGYLAWIGRLDEEKAVHYAIDAARVMGRRLVVMGEPIRSVRYFESIRTRLAEPHVNWIGTQVGEAKMEYLARADAVVYTCSPDWIEAAAAVLWESLLSGVPLAGMSWRGGEAVVEAVGEGIAGAVAAVRVSQHYDANIELLSQAIETAAALDRSAVAEYAQEKFNPFQHARWLISE
jgi:glycosyltransferase involved in cell wall biosynthesis